MPLDTNRLRVLRAQRGLSQAELADKAKLSKRQVQRLESDADATLEPRDRTVRLLAGALRVQPGVLLGELPMPNLKQRPDASSGQRTQVSALLLPEIRLAYALIKRRYGVKPTTLFNAAPLLFVLLAESSLLWRKEKMQEVDQATNRLRELQQASRHGHLSFVNAVYEVEEGSSAEEESIDQKDIFGRNVGETAFEFGYDRSTNNPFADYLRELAVTIDDPEIVQLFDWVNYGPLEDFPGFKVWERELDTIAAGSWKAAFALEKGYARVSDIPDELMSDEAAPQRAAWLEQRLPEELQNASEADDLELLNLFEENAAERKGDDQ